MMPAVVTWPPTAPGLIAPLLQAAGIALEADPARAERVVVDCEDLALASVAGFDAAVAEGRAEDSPAGFLDFASRCHDDLADFRARWQTGADLLVIARAALRADPDLWLRRLGDFVLAPAAGAAEIDRLRAAATAVFAARPAPDVTRFRHHDAAVFDRIGAFALTRAEVGDVFAAVMGRRIDAPAIPHFQGAASTGHLRRMLMNSAEYRRRQGAPAGSRAQPAAAAEPRTIIHLHVPKTAGTSLNTLLNRNYPKDRILPLHTAILPTLAAMPEDERRKLQVIHGHLAHGVAELLPQPSIYLCVLRRPAARLFSYYQFILRRPQHPLHGAVAGAGLDFGPFLSFVAADPNLRQEFDNGQMRRIAGPRVAGPDLAVLQAALRHLLAPDMIFGLTEHYDLFVSALEARGLIRRAVRIEQNVSPRGTDHGEVMARLTPEERQLHDAFCLWDEQLYSVAETFLLGPSRSEH